MNPLPCCKIRYYLRSLILQRARKNCQFLNKMKSDFTYTHLFCDTVLMLGHGALKFRNRILPTQTQCASIQFQNLKIASRFFFQKNKSFICWSIFEVFLIFSLFLELRRLWDHSQIVDLIFLIRMVSTRAHETSKTPHSWQNNVPKRSTKYF